MNIMNIDKIQMYKIINKIVINFISLNVKEF